VSSAEAVWVGTGLYGGYDLETADLDGDKSDELFVPAYYYDYWDHSSPVEFWGQVVPGASALASSSIYATDWTGVVTIHDDLLLGGNGGLPGSFGPIGDIDGDGHPDVAYPQPTMDEGPFVFSGATLSTSRFTGGNAYTSDADLTIEGDVPSGRDVYRQLSAIGAADEGGALQVAQWTSGRADTRVNLYPLPVVASTLELDDAGATISTSRVFASGASLDVDGDGIHELFDLFYGTSSKPLALEAFDLLSDGETVTEAEARVSVDDPLPSGVDDDENNFLLPGDINNDGLGDLVLSHACHDATGEGGCNGIVAGLTSLSSVAGSVDLADIAAWSITGVEAYSNVGLSAALVPDVDSDSVPEIFAFAARRGDYWCSYGVYTSTTWVDGGSFGEEAASRTYLGNSTEDAFEAVSAGDLDGDGNPELLIQFGPYTGGAWIFSW
jgi:hypothetical protein